MNFRPVHRLLEKARKHRARKAAKALALQGVVKRTDKRQSVIDRLSEEVGRPSFKLERRA